MNFSVKFYVNSINVSIVSPAFHRFDFLLSAANQLLFARADVGETKRFYKVKNTVHMEVTQIACILYKMRKYLSWLVVLKCVSQFGKDRVLILKDILKIAIWRRSVLDLFPLYSCIFLAISLSWN